ncbi:MAG: putative protease [uncultured marine phage]|uniref:Putative protease n=1 Tax=uncultured marine phage TaxID=707152 RepID=A0A8D9CEX8_9VIRU|nr:MAG: putative protease [uncultured marine phage]
MKIIGRTDFFNFPELELNFVEVKIDTGAFSSALHCESAKLIDEVLVVDFGNGNVKVFEEYGTKRITSSNGTTQTRFSIVTTVELFGDIEYIEVTLANRSTMKSKCLLGRTFLSPNEILVYVRKRNLSIKSILPFFEGVENFNLYHEDRVLESKNIYELFNEIENLIYTKDIKKVNDFRKTTNMKRLEKYYFMNGETKVTLDKFPSFMYNSKEKGVEWYMNGEEYFKVEDEL